MNKQISFEQAVKAATTRLLRSRTARTYTAKATQYDEAREYELELGLVGHEDGTTALEVQTLGYDYAEIAIPTTREELINLKTRCQLSLSPSPGGPAQVALRYYLSILRYEQDGHFGV